MKRKQRDAEEKESEEAEEVSIRRKIIFDSESDDEVSFDIQAHKKRRMGLDMEELKVWFRAELKTKMGEQTEKITETIKENTERGIKNSEDIADLKLAISRIEANTINPSFQPLGPSYAGAAAARPDSSIRTSDIPSSSSICIPRAYASSQEERKSFELSRRSLRIWPIDGSTEKQLMDAVAVFFCQALGAPRKDELGIKSVKRVKSAPRGIAFLEVLVEFSDTYARDDILMRGPMLSGYRDPAGKPTTGIRLDIPTHLMGSFKTLEAFGFALKRRHGQGLRKHIKFDDFTGTLYMQAGVKKEENAPIDWTDFTAEEAREGIKKLNAKKGPRFDYLATPTKKDDEQEKEKRTERRNSAFPWIPPTRKKATDAENTGRDWAPTTREEAENSDNMTD